MVGRGVQEGLNDCARAQVGDAAPMWTFQQLANSFALEL